MNAQLLEDEGLGPDPPHRDRLRSKEELSQAEKVNLDLDLNLGWEGRAGYLHQCWDGGLSRALSGTNGTACSCPATPVPTPLPCGDCSQSNWKESSKTLAWTQGSPYRLHISHLRGLVCSLGTQVEETPFCSRTFKELRLGNKMLEGPLETLGEPRE